MRAPRQLVSELHFRPEQTDALRSLFVQTPALAALQQAQVATLRQTAIVVGAGGAQTSSLLPVPLPGMIHNALLSCTPESRRELCNNGGMPRVGG